MVFPWPTILGIQEACVLDPTFCSLFYYAKAVSLTPRSVLEADYGAGRISVRFVVVVLRFLCKGFGCFLHVHPWEGSLRTASHLLVGATPPMTNVYFNFLAWVLFTSCVGVGVFSVIALLKRSLPQSWINVES